MTDTPHDANEEVAQMSDQSDPELSAIQVILGALTALKSEQRQRVIDYVFQRLGLTAVQSVAPNQPPAAPFHATPLPPHTPTPHPTTPVINDIRSLKEHKKPRSANEMAALVAYYLAELAPVSHRKSEIGTDDITTYFKQAGYPLPAVLRNTLVNAKASGYFDSASHGLYKLNPVGHNLVVHGLPPTGNDTKSSARTKRTVRKAPAKTKATKVAKKTKRR